MKYLFYLFLLAIALFSCNEEYLDEPPKEVTQKTQESIPSEYIAKDANSSTKTTSISNYNREALFFNNIDILEPAKLDVLYEGRRLSITNFNNPFTSGYSFVDEITRMDVKKRRWLGSII